METYVLSMHGIDNTFFVAFIHQFEFDFEFYAVLKLLKTKKNNTNNHKWDAINMDLNLLFSSWNQSKHINSDVDDDGHEKSTRHARN